MSLTKEALAQVIRAHDDWAERVAPDDPIACKCGHRVVDGSVEDHQIEMVWEFIEANTTEEWGVQAPDGVVATGYHEPMTEPEARLLANHQKRNHTPVSRYVSDWKAEGASL